MPEASKTSWLARIGTAEVGRPLIVLLTLLIITLSGCGENFDQSRVLSLVNRLLLDQADTPTSPGDGNEDRLASNASENQASTIRIIEAADASTLDEPDEVPDSQALFSYEDTSGSTRMVKGLHNVPAAFQSSAKNLSNGGGRQINRYDAAAVMAKLRPRAMEPGSDFNPNRLDITLYSATWCGACKRARQLLDSEGVLYQLRDIDDDPSARDVVKSILGSVRIPLIDINGTFVTGYDRATILRLIKGG